MSNGMEHVAALRDIRDMMQRSSKFISLSALSGIAAGTWALVGSWCAARLLAAYYADYERQGLSGRALEKLEISLLVIAAPVLAAALVSAFYLTWRSAQKKHQPVWDPLSNRMTLSMP